MSFQWQRKKLSPSRLLSLFPRVGIVVDVAGYEFAYKHVPFMESVLNLAQRGLNPKHLPKIIREQMQEIQFPKENKEKIIDASYQQIHSQ